MTNSSLLGTQHDAIVAGMMSVCKRLVAHVKEVNGTVSSVCVDEYKLDIDLSAVPGASELSKGDCFFINRDGSPMLNDENNLHIMWGNVQKLEEQQARELAKNTSQKPRMH